MKLFRITLFLSSLLLAELLIAQEIKAKFDEKLTIGDIDDNARPEYIFIFATHIVTDSHGNIYISDTGVSEIRVFNKYGKFIRYIGKKGQGPGEIQEVTCMAVDGNDNLIVFDRWNHRFTTFMDMGKKFITRSMPLQEHVDAYKIFPLGENSFLLYYHLPSKRNHKFMVSQNDRIFHIFSNDFSKIKSSFANAGDIWDLKQPFLRTLVGKFFSNLFVISQDKIIFSPGFYEGKLYMYYETGGCWDLQVLNGKTPNRRSYKLLNRADYQNPEDYPVWIMSTSGPGYGYFVQQRNMSAGIFALNNGTIVHFSRSLKPDEKTTVFGVEIFNYKGKYIGYCPISQDLPKNTDKSIYYHKVLWKDKNDLFYVLAIKSDCSLIKVLSLSICRDFK